MHEFGKALRMFLWMTIVAGLAYPILITGTAQLLFQSKANGGLIVHEGKVVGATLIGQKFTSKRYFWGRPSATDYSPLPSGGSHLAPTSNALKEAVAERRTAIVKSHGIDDNAKIPIELLFASASGIDPHISPETALFQVDRVLKARDLTDKNIHEKVNNLISTFTEDPLLGPPCVNVLKLNIALDEMTKPQTKTAQKQ